MDNLNGFMESQDNNDNLEQDISVDNSQFSKIKSKRILLIAIVIIIGLPILGILFYKYSKIKSAENIEIAKEQKNEILYYDLSPIVVNLDTHGEGNKFLKISITLKFNNNSSLEMAKKLEPSLRDEYFTFLRQLRSSDVTGSVAIYRLKDSLYKRTNKILYPEEIQDLLIQDILIQ